jgi:hypothetical protein
MSFYNETSNIILTKSCYYLHGVYYSSNTIHLLTSHHKVYVFHSPPPTNSHPRKGVLLRLGVHISFVYIVEWTAWAIKHVISIDIFKYILCKWDIMFIIIIVILSI